MTLPDLEHLTPDLLRALIDEDLQITPSGTPRRALEEPA